MRILHISDLHFWHITLNPFRLAGKRFLGMGNLIVNRAWKFRMGTMPALVEHALDVKPDHLLITGDLTTTALEEEFRAVRQALEPLNGTPSSVTIIPGNHDRYTRRATRARLFEEYFGKFAPELNYPWLRRLDGRAAILALDACPRARISARGTISTDHLEQAQQLLDAADPGISKLLIACHYPAALPEGIRDLRGHGLNGAEDLRSFLAAQGPHLYCHGHIHTPWIFSPRGLPQTLCLNPGAALKRNRGQQENARMLEIVLIGNGVQIKRHTMQKGKWEVTELRDDSDFFRKERLL